MSKMKKFQAEDFEIAASKVEAILSKEESVEQILETGAFVKDAIHFHIDTGQMESFVQNFRDRVIGTDPPVNFGHERGGKAAGWIKDVFLDPTKTKLFALIKWTASGLDALKGRTWRYLSAEFTNVFLDGSTGQQFGPTLAGAALTNVPFLRHMPPVVGLSSKEIEIELKQVDGKPQKGDRKMAEETISVADHNAAIKHLNTQIEKLSDEKIELGKDVEEVTRLRSENEDLKKKLADVMRDIDTQKKEAKFTDLLSKGQACAAQKEAFMSDDMEKFIELSQPLNLNGVGHSDSGDDKVEKFKDLSKAEQKFYADNLVAVMSEDEYMKHRSAPIAQAENVN